MIIKDIQNIKTNKTRTDGRYPRRIGSTVRFAFPLCISQCMFLEYQADKNGAPKDGYLRTSSVIDVEETETEFIVETLNSRYILGKD